MRLFWEWTPELLGSKQVTSLLNCKVHGSEFKENFTQYREMPVEFLSQWTACCCQGETDSFPEVLSTSYPRKKRKRELRRDEKRENTDIQNRSLQSPYPLSHNPSWVEEGKGEREWWFDLHHRNSKPNDSWKSWAYYNQTDSTTWNRLSVLCVCSWGK